MAYPKTTNETKMKFIADVINRLEERGEQKKSECLRKHTKLQKQYEAAQRYSREMTAYDNDETPSQPLSDINIEIHDTETALQNYRETHPTQGNAQLPMQQTTYSKPSKPKTIKQLSKERRKELMEKHYELLDWIQCIDDGIVKGNLDEAQRIIGVFDDYGDRLQNLLSERYFNRAKTLLLQLKEIERVIPTDEMDRIKNEVESYATVNAV